MSIAELAEFFKKCEKEQLVYKKGMPILNKIITKLQYMIDVGLGYLALSRKVPTLSGGETQRMFLASYMISNLDSIIFTFDEPTIGLHECEKKMLINKMRRLVDVGNTVIIVEHDKSVIEEADYVVEIGPHAGTEGGILVYQGNYESFINNENSITAKYLRNPMNIMVELGPKSGKDGGYIIATGAPSEIKKQESSVIGKYLIVG